MKKRCNAVAKSTKSQCKKSALPYSNYCFWHYPKGSILAGAFLSAVLVIFIGTIVSDSIKNKLSEYKLFYYLDKKEPIIRETNPELKNNINIFNTLDSIQFIIEDEGSKINYDNCEINLFRVKNTSKKKLSLEIDNKDSYFLIQPSKKLNIGKYLSEIKIIDMAGNILKKTHTIIIKDKDDIDVYVESNCIF